MSGAPALADLGARGTVLVAVLATAVCLHTVVQGWLWFAELAVLLGFVTILGFLLGRRFGEQLVAGLQVGALLFGIHAVYAGSQAGFGLAPTPASLELLVDLVRVDALESIAEPPPAPATAGMRLLVVAIGSVVWTSVAFTRLAVGSAALSGVGLLMLYVLPTTLAPDGVPWWLFLPGALGYLLLLAGDHGDRLREWGPRAVHQARPRLLVPVAAGVVLASVAGAAAVLVPARFDGMQRREAPSYQDLTRRGDQTITIVNPVQSLREDLVARGDAPVLHWSGGDRGGTPEPLRLGTVDVFDGDAWSPTYGRISRSNDVTRGLPEPPGLSAAVQRRTLTTTITIDTLQQNWLTVPFPPTRVDVDDEWLYDPQTFNITGPGTTPGQQYTVEHLLVQPTPAQLTAAPRAGAGFDRWRELPALPAVVTDTAAEIAGTGSDYDKALALQEWLREDGGFTYSLDAPPQTGNDAIEDFLRSRRGYCVHFASTMTVMARAQGIPARVAIGFLPGDQVGPDLWQVSQQDAHAWPELYFEGAGWVRFEPTPAGQAATVPPWTEPQDAPAPAPAPTTATPPPASPATESPVQQPERSRAPAATLLLLLVAAPAALTVAVFTLWTVRRRRRAAARDSAEAALTDLVRRLRLLGVDWQESWTVRQSRDTWLESTRRRAPDRAEEVAARLDRIVAGVESARYGEPGTVLTLPPPDLRAEVDGVVRALSPGAPWWRRLTARW